MLFRTSLLSLVFAVSAAPSVLASPAGAQAVPSSPAAAALAAGDCDGALRLPARSAEEAAYVRARVALSHFRLDEAERLAQEVWPMTPPGAELRWRIAHARKDPARIAEAAALFAALGDPTGRAAADAELYARGVYRQSVELSAPTSTPLSESAPVPVYAAEASGRPLGAVLDTGASQTTISAKLARNLGLVTTEAAFPVGVAAGGNVAMARLAILPHLFIGEAQVRHLPVLVVEMPELEALGVSMILSPQQALDGLSVEVDFERSRLTLRPGAAAAQEPATAKLEYMQAGFDLAVHARMGDGPPALFGFDTGLEAPFSLAPSYAAYLGDELALGTSSDIGGAGGSAAVTAVAPVPIYAGGAVLRPRGEGFQSEMPSTGAFKMAGLLGSGLWRGQRVTIDTVNKRIVVAAPNPSGEADGPPPQES